MEKMLNHLSEESKQAAATTLVSPPPAPALSQSLTEPWDTGLWMPLLTPGNPHSPPARKTCAPSATHTPSQPSSGPAPISHASE